MPRTTAWCLPDQWRVTKIDRLGLGLVQGRIVEDQQTALDGGREGWASRHRISGSGSRRSRSRVNASWAGGSATLGLHLGGLRAGEELGAADNEVDVVGVAALNVVRHNDYCTILTRLTLHGHIPTTA